MSDEIPFLRLTGLSKRFGGGRALEEIDWDVRPGEIHCLVGENGCGKSTLIKTVAGGHPVLSKSRASRFFRLIPPARKHLEFRSSFRTCRCFRTYPSPKILPSKTISTGS